MFNFRVNIAVLLTPTPITWTVDLQNFEEYAASNFRVHSKSNGFGYFHFWKTTLKPMKMLEGGRCEATTLVTISI